MVPDTEHRRAHHLPTRLLRVARGQEVVGAVLQAALARHHRHLSQGDHHLLNPQITCKFCFKDTFRNFRQVIDCVVRGW